MSDSIPGKLIEVDSIPANRLKPAAGILRSQLELVSNAIFKISPFDWRIWDSGQVLPAAAAADDLAVIAGTWGTDNFTVQAGDLKAAGATTRYAVTRRKLPEHYEDGKTVTLRLRAGMKTTAADTSCTIDAEVYKVEDDALAGADICTTAAQSMNSTTEADLDFVITPTGLVAGDELEIRIAIACNDGATATAVIPTLFKAALLCDVRG